MKFSLHCKIEYFKNNNCFPSILNLFFQLMRLFRNNFQRDVQHSIHTSDITECSFHSWKYCSRVTWVDCKIEILVLYKRLWSLFLREGVIGGNFLPDNGLSHTVHVVNNINSLNSQP